MEAYQTGWTYSPGVAEFSARTLCEGPTSRVFGQFDPARMQQVVATFGPILQRSGSISDVPDPASLYTNEFVDPNIRMG